MPTPKKVEIVKNLAQKLSKAHGVYLTDYRGLSVPQMQELRNRLVGADCEYMVTKNTLLKIALRETGYPDTPIEGPTAVALAFKDELLPLKTLAEFAQTAKKPEFKGGFLGKKFLPALRLGELACLPGVEFLKSRLVQGLAYPLRSTTYALNWNLQKLVLTLALLSKTKSEGGETNGR